MSDAITPFQLNIAEDQLDDLRRRLDTVRWPETETVDDWSQGIPLAYMQEIVDYWRNDYDWRRWENMLNEFGQYKTEIDGLNIHFLHIRSPHENALPIVITHGWPGSVAEFYKVIGPLTDPTEHGGNAEDAFHVVCPSLPGYGFSDRPTETGWGIEKIGRTWGRLMDRLGYTRYVAQGGDWGAIVTQSMGLTETEHCAAIHVNMPIASPDSDTMDNLTPIEQKALDAMGHYDKEESGYSKQQSTRPQTLGYGLVDSPTAEAAWIIEKFYAWTDCGEGDSRHPENVLTKDELLDNVMMYWLTATGASSARLYWESFSSGTRSSEQINMPIGCSIFPKEIIRISRRWAEKRFSNLIHWNEMDKGGHFAAFEQPELFIEELRNCFRQMR